LHKKLFFFIRKTFWKSYFFEKEKKNWIMDCGICFWIKHYRSHSWEKKYLPL